MEKLAKTEPKQITHTDDITHCFTCTVGPLTYHTVLYSNKVNHETFCKNSFIYKKCYKLRSSGTQKHFEQAVREAATTCPRPCKLTFDLLTLKVVSESRVI